MKTDNKDKELFFKKQIFLSVFYATIKTVANGRQRSLKRGVAFALAASTTDLLRLKVPFEKNLKKAHRTI